MEKLNDVIAKGLRDYSHCEFGEGDQFDNSSCLQVRHYLGWLTEKMLTAGIITKEELKNRFPEIE